MIRAVFYSTDNKLSGFTLSGHGTENENDFEGRLICSAVSSAVYMTVNTITDIIGAEIEYSDSGDEFSVRVLTNLTQTEAILKGLKLHLNGLKQEYKNKITIISEV